RLARTGHHPCRAGSASYLLIRPVNSAGANPERPPDMELETLESRRMFNTASMPSPTPDPKQPSYGKEEIVLQTLGQPTPRLDGSILYVNGTDQGDTIDARIDYDAGLLRVWINGASFAYPGGTVHLLQIDSGKGNDMVTAEILPGG